MDNLTKCLWTSFVLATLTGIPYNSLANEIEVPWLIRPMSISASGIASEVFPKVSGLNPDRIAIQPDFTNQSPTDTQLFFKQRQYLHASEIMDHDPAFAAGWNHLVQQVRNIISHEGQGLLKNVKPERYIYVLSHRLLVCSLYYRMTGDTQVGLYLKELVINTATLPMSFWMHSSLRKYDIDWPKGQLETASLSRGMATSLIWGHELFSESEVLTIQNALRDKGLYPMLRYLETVELHNNFLSAIASGALIASVALKNPLAQEHSLALLLKWGTLVEIDGSYGEQIDYFNYACSNFAKGMMALGREHLLDASKKISQLKNSLKWQLSHFSLDSNHLPVRLNFGDDDFQGGPPSRFVTFFLTMITNQGLGSWMLDTLYGTQPVDDAYTMIAKIVFAGIKLPDAESPETLPLTQRFDNGIGITRSSWTMSHDTVLAIRSGGGNRTLFSHDVPNRNAIAMMFNGDYLLVEPGRASYRSELRKKYDLITKHHNTVTLSGANQLGTPVSDLLTAKQVNDQLSVIVSEASQSYQMPPRQLRRSVYYLHDFDVFVIWDVIHQIKPDTIQVNWHFGNYEMKSKLTLIEKNHWQLLKPDNLLDTWVFTSDPASSLTYPGIMHLDYSYFPGDPNEGQQGNAFELQIASKEPVKNFMAVSIFAPQTRKQAIPINIKAQFKDKMLFKVIINKMQESTTLILDGNLTNSLKQVAATINGVTLNIDGAVLNHQKKARN